jgi:hypothetical protein
MAACAEHIRKAHLFAVKTFGPRAGRVIDELFSAHNTVVLMFHGLVSLTIIT